MSVAANRYAKALIDALPLDQAETGYNQLFQLKTLLRDEVDARRLLQNPTVSVDRRKAFLQQIGTALGFGKSIHNFLEILIERNRLDILDEIVVAYQNFLDEKLGIVRATVTAAQPLDDAQRNELSGKLERVTGKRVRMDVSVDPNLIGGVVARVGTTIYDGSLRQQLQAFKARLVQG